MRKTLDTKYDHLHVEMDHYKSWIDHGYFTAGDKSKDPFCIVIPPPNVTGKLHLGHAWDTTLQDIVSRYKRMQGYDMLWLPGMDHAGIATQAKVDERLKSEGISRYDIGREKFLERAWEWKEEYASTIRKQWAKMGLSLDYSRERFTLDEGLSDAVRRVFVDLYNDGLIYQGERIINWDPQAKTALSNIEVIHKEIEGAMYYFKYKVVETGKELVIATTRPETMFADQAIFVHPEDERYKNIVGMHVINPANGEELPIMADDYIDMSFGTAVMKCTPAHDPNDFALAKKYHLAMPICMHPDGTMNEMAHKYAGMDRFACRKALVADFEKDGVVDHIEQHMHQVGHSERTGVIVEPYLSKQWFVRMEPLAEEVLKNQEIEEQKIHFYPQRFEKTFHQWLENIEDWCISRQLWWGHRIPAYYCDECGEVVVARSMPDVCPKCGCTHLHQDEDTLDTWFSSALWPFSTLGWPEKTPELSYFYPTDTLVTGYDIIFFWVARMIFSGLEHMGDIPFKTVFFHGLVRDAQGRKMSKSLGNGIDPIEVIEKYGADALRFTLVTGNSPGNDMRFTEEKLESSRNFANKIWNAARFIHMNIDGFDVKNELPESLTLEDQWIVSALNTVTKEVTENLEKYELGIAVQKLYDFIWDQFCDWYIELAKTRLMAKDETSVGARQVLVWTFTSILKLMHPFMPYITEEIWQTMPHEGEALMAADYPIYNEKYAYPQAEAEMHRIMETIRAIRNRRAEMNVPPSRRAKVYVASSFEETFRKGAQFVARLAYASEVEVGEAFSIPGAVTIVTADAKVYIPMDELVDKEAELKRLNKELETAQKQLDQVNAKLNNPGFTGKAPANVVEGARQNAQKLEDKIKMIASSIEALNG